MRPREAAEEGSAGWSAATLKEEGGERERAEGDGGLAWFCGTRVSRSSSSSETEGPRSMAAEGECRWAVSSAGEAEETWSEVVTG